MYLSGPFESKVIHSIQLGQGVGGFRLERLLNLLEALKKKKNKKQLILVSTACRCHGVISALSFYPEESIQMIKFQTGGVKRYESRKKGTRSI